MATLRAFRPRLPARPFLLVLCALFGAGAVLAWPRARQNGDTLLQGATPPILSVRDAQRQVPFRIIVPDDLPAGGRLIGVRVTRVRDVLLPGQSPTWREEAYRTLAAVVHSRRRQTTGYGLEIYHVGRRYLVRAVTGSPAQAAGLDTHDRSVLLAVAGRPVAAIGRGEPEQRSGNIVAFVRGLRPPIVITVRDALDRERSISIPGTGNYLYPDMGGAISPTGPIHTPQAALLLEAHGRQLALIESRPAPGEAVWPATHGDNQRVAQIGSTAVWLGGDEDAPSAAWNSGGMHFWLNNYQKAVNRDEALQMIASVR